MTCYHSNVSCLLQEDSYGGGEDEFCSMNLMAAGFGGGGQESLSFAKPKMLSRKKSVSPPPALDVAVAKVHACNVCCRVCI